MGLISDNKICPLCGEKQINHFHEDKHRRYLQCVNCKLVFVPSEFWLSTKEEKATYDLHINDPSDKGYRRFLSRLKSPLQEKLEPDQVGLDFGCGPGPTLSVMMEEEHYQMDLYDPFYFNDISVFGKKYDFITSTEVMEHLQNPRLTLKKLFHMLKPGAYLGIMTKLVKDQNAFKKWHYIHDLTHICFFSRKTFEYITEQYSAHLEIIGNDVIILQKK